MPELTGYKLAYQPDNGTEVDITLYDNVEECPEPNLKLNVNGTDCFAKLGAETDDGATDLMVQVVNGLKRTTYAVLKEYVTDTTFHITQSDNQTIHIYTTENGTEVDHTSTFTVPFGTEYRVEVVPNDDQHLAGDIIIDK